MLDDTMSNDIGRRYQGVNEAVPLVYNHGVTANPEIKKNGRKMGERRI